MIGDELNFQGEVWKGDTVLYASRNRKEHLNTEIGRNLNHVRDSYNSNNTEYNNLN